MQQILQRAIPANLRGTYWACFPGTFSTFKTLFLVLKQRIRIGFWNVFCSDVKAWLLLAVRHGKSLSESGLLYKVFELFVHASFYIMCACTVPFVLFSCVLSSISTFFSDPLSTHLHSASDVSFLHCRLKSDSSIWFLATKNSRL